MISRILLPFTTLACLGWILSPSTALAAAPAAPAAFKATAIAYNYVGLSWVDSSTDEVGFEIEYKVGAGAYTIYSNAVPPNSTTRPAVGTLANTSYTFRIRAYNLSGATRVYSAYKVSNAVTTPAATAKFGAPSNFTATTTTTTFELAWTDNATVEDGYEVRLRTSLTDPFVSLGWINATSVGLTGGDPGTPYYFEIAARKVVLSAGGVLNDVFFSTPSNPTVTAVTKDVITSAATTSGTPGTPFSHTFTNTAGSPVTSRSLTSVPASLSFTSSAGSLTGTYPPPGDYTLAYTVNFANGWSQTQNFSIKTASITSSLPQLFGTPGAAFNHTFTNTGGYAVASRILTGKPSSLELNGETGELSGVCPPAGSYPMVFTLTYDNGWQITQSFTLRIYPAIGAPLVGSTIPDWTALVGASRDTPLAGTFTDPSAESGVRIATTKGDIDVILYNGATPATVTNFMNYVNRGDYTNVVFHRAPQNFVLQGGAFRSTGTGNNFTAVPKDSPVINEPGIPNTRGTLSMAKLGGNPDSATNQFFISMQDNRSILDAQNGGFTVFGRVAGNGMTVVDAINALPERTYTVSIIESTQTSFDSFPVDAPAAPDIMDPATFIKMTTVAPIPTLNHSITANTNPSVATAAILNGQLHLTGLSGGQTSITITATNLDNLSASQTFNVQLSDTYASWAARTDFPGGQSASSQNPDGDPLNNFLEYAFLANPTIADPAPAFGRTSVPEMTLTFPVRKFVPTLTYTVQAAPNLTGPWTDVWSTSQGFVHAQVVTATDLPDRTFVTIRDLQPITASGHRFMQVRVTEL